MAGAGSRRGSPLPSWQATHLRRCEGDGPQGDGLVGARLVEPVDGPAHGPGERDGAVQHRLGEVQREQQRALQRPAQEARRVGDRLLQLQPVQRRGEAALLAARKDQTQIELEHIEAAVERIVAGL